MSRHRSGGLGGKGSSYRPGRGGGGNDTRTDFSKAHDKAPEAKPNDIIMKWTTNKSYHYKLPSDHHLNTKSHGELSVHEIQKVMDELSKSTFFYKTSFTDEMYLCYVCLFPLVPVFILAILAAIWPIFIYIAIGYSIAALIIAIVLAFSVRSIWNKKVKHRAKMITEKLAEISARPRFSPRIVWSCDPLATYVRIEFKFVDEEGNLKKVQEPLSLVVDKSQEHLLLNKGAQKRNEINKVTPAQPEWRGNDDGAAGKVDVNLNEVQILG